MGINFNGNATFTGKYFILDVDMDSQVTWRIWKKSDCILLGTSHDSVGAPRFYDNAMQSMDRGLSEMQRKEVRIDWE